MGSLISFFGIIVPDHIYLSFQLCFIARMGASAEEGRDDKSTQRKKGGEKEDGWNE